MMCLKQSAKKMVSQHLKNCLNYILNPGKNEEGKWVGGNCGFNAGECYQTMMATKDIFAYQRSDKLLGRQGYHFMIALPPGEGDMDTLMQVVDEFCITYLGDNYDYVFSCHTDRPHKHAHIVFNSVSRTTGKKYHYNNGDWAKDIQPLVNQICQKYGLTTLEIGTPNLETTEHKNLSYDVWKEEKSVTSWKKIVQMDIDRVVAEVGNFEEFLRAMSSEGYSIRQGQSKKYDAYFSFLPPGAKKAVRSYSLGEGYSVRDLQARCSGKRFEHYQISEADFHYSVRVPVCVQRFYIRGPVSMRRKQMSQYQLAYAKRVERARRAYRGNVTNVGKFRKDFQELQKLSGELTYLCKKGLGNQQDLKRHEENLQKRLWNMRKTRTMLYHDYAFYRKGSPSLFLLCEMGQLPANQVTDVNSAYQKFQIQKNRISSEIKSLQAEIRTCDHILERLKNEREEFLKVPYLEQRRGKYYGK